MLLAGGDAEEQLGQQRVVVVPHSTVLSQADKAMLGRLESRGGKVLIFGAHTPDDALGRIRTAAGTRIGWTLTGLRTCWRC